MIINENPMVNHCNKYVNCFLRIPLFAILERYIRGFCENDEKEKKNENKRKKKNKI